MQWEPATDFFSFLLERCVRKTRVYGLRYVSEFFQLSRWLSPRWRNMPLHFFCVVPVALVVLLWVRTSVFTPAKVLSEAGLSSQSK